MGIVRFILAISVVIAHSSPIFGCSLVGGQIAVQAFYIISGFYMALILNEKYVGINDSFKLFITNRLLRLYPIYWAVLVLTILGSALTMIFSNGSNLGKFWIYAEHFTTMGYESIIFLVFTNIFLFLQDVVMFLGLDTSTGQLFFTADFNQTSPQLHQFLFIPQAWTIGIELTFYLIAPFLVRRNLNIIIILILSSLLLRFTLVQNGLSHDPWSYRFFPTELVFFLLGIVSYKLYSKVRNTTIRKSHLFTILIGLICLTLFFNFLPLTYKTPLYLCVFFICLPFIFILTQKWKIDSYIGELSYPIYISHLFVLMCLKVLKIPAWFGTGLTLTLTTVLFSIFLNELIARKIERVRQNRLRTTS